MLFPAGSSIEPETLSLLTGLALPYGSMLAIPGPNVLLVIRSSLDRNRGKPLATAAGIASGAALAASVAAWSATFFPHGRAVQLIMSLIFAALLIRAAIRLAVTVPSVPIQSEPMDLRDYRKPFLFGIGAALFNPVTIPFFVSFFLSHACSGVATVMACGLVFCMAALWFTALGVACSRLGAIRVPPRWIDALKGSLALLLTASAARVVWTAVAA